MEASARSFRRLTGADRLGDSPIPVRVIGLSRVRRYGDGVATLIVAPAAPPEDEVRPVLRTESNLQAAPASGRPTKKADQFAQAMVLVVLFAAPALMCVHAAVASDLDIWWHLRTGEWILQHHALPRVDSFSGPLAGKPWAAYSWLFELLSIQLFQRFGLVGIVGYSAGMVLAITVALQHLIKRLQPDFSVVALLTFATCFSLEHLFKPRPWAFTVLFFVLEIDILMHARKTGRTRELAWLPVIFALWSNLHIQFIDGLVVLGIALAEAVLVRWNIGVRTRLRAPWLLAAAFAGSVIGTMANPSGWHIYRVAYDLAAQAGVMDKISELQAMRFRDLSDFCLLFLALASPAALAWSRRFRLFETGLLDFASVVSFRSLRDVWVMATVSAAILASTIVGREKAAVRLPRFATALAVLGVALAVLAGFRMMHVNNAQLQAQVASSLPVRAVEVIRAKGYAGPLYNDFNWGGYLIWSLRMPVSIDGRAAFYGDKSIDRSVATWNAEPDWAADPALQSAGLVVGPAQSPLTQLLRVAPGFTLVFEDKVAAVFVANKQR